MGAAGCVIRKHKAFPCLRRSPTDRTFYRKDHMMQHVLDYHLGTASDAVRERFRIPEFWAQEQHQAERRRMHNRIAQRNYRKLLKARLETLERRM
jgi:hypothetical protein